MVVIHDGGLSDWIERFKSRTLHFVCVASSGLTPCDFTASTLGGMRQEDDVRPLTRRVNRKGETGTFWPKLPLTVVPQISWEGRQAPHDIDGFLRQCFEDVAKANREYVKLPEMFIDLNPCGGRFDMDRAMAVAREVLSREESISNIWFADKLT